MENAIKRPVGRPASKSPKPGLSGKGRAVTINMSQDMRDALETEAERTGRSMSQIAERWMEKARSGCASLEHMVGGHDLVGVIEKLGDIRRRIDKLTLSDELKRLALIEAWTDAVRFLLPPLVSANDLETERAFKALKATCDTLLQALVSAGEGDPVYDAAMARNPINAFSGEPWRRPAADVIAGAALYGQMDGLGDALDTLFNLEHPTAVTELRAANLALLQVLELSTEKTKDRLAAMKAGLKASRATLGLPWNDLLK